MVSSSAVPQENETGGMESISADVKGGPNNEATPTVGGGGGGTCGDICLARDASGSNNDQSPAIASGNGPSVEQRLLVLKKSKANI